VSDKLDESHAAVHLFRPGLTGKPPFCQRPDHLGPEAPGSVSWRSSELGAGDRNLDALIGEVFGEAEVSDTLLLSAHRNTAHQHSWPIVGQALPLSGPPFDRSLFGYSCPSGVLGLCHESGAFQERQVLGEAGKDFGSHKATTWVGGHTQPGMTVMVARTMNSAES